MAVAISCAGLAGLAFGIPAIGSLFAGYRTVSFSGALFWIFFGTVLALHGTRPLAGRPATVVRAVLVIIAILEAIELPLSLTGTQSAFEILSIQAGGALLGHPITPISPATSVLVIVASLALFIVLSPAGTRKQDRQARDAVGIAGVAVGLAEFTFLMSYAYGVPLLSATSLIPFAPISALAGFFTGAGLVMAAGPDAFPVRYFIGSSIRARLLRVFIPLVVVLTFAQNIIFFVISDVYRLRDAFLLSVCIVAFSIATAWVIARFSGRIGGELELADDAVRESEAKFHEIFDSINDAIHVHEIRDNGLPGKFIDMNAVACRMLGYSRDELLLRSPIDFSTGFHSIPLEQIGEDLRVRGRAFFETEHRRRDGSVIPVEVNSHVAVINGRRLVISVVRDITDRRQAEEALRESEARFRLALKNAPVSVATQDRDMRFTWAYNQRTIPAEMVIGKTDADIFAPEDVAVLTALKQQVMETGTEMSRQLWITSNGKKIFIDLYIEPLRNAAGAVTGVGLATVDLTAVKRAEEALEAGRNILETVIGSTPDFITMKDREGRYVMINAPAARALSSSAGIRPEEIVGRADATSTRPTWPGRHPQPTMRSWRLKKCSSSTRRYPSTGKCGPYRP